MSLREWVKRMSGAVRGGREAAARADDPSREAEVGFNDEDADFDTDDPFPAPIRLAPADVIDLHTFAPRDVRRAVEEYLLEARRAGFRSVRIIHGKGRGVQRELVRKILARTPFVHSFTDAPPAAGGFGATVAHLRRDEGGGMRDEKEIIPPD